MRWEEFATACPEIAGKAEERLRRYELCMLGTLRADGWPRISPTELDFVRGELVFGMMWQSKKARDLRRDPRCVVHNCVANRMNDEGDVKLYGRAVDVRDPELRQAYRETILARIGWAPDEPNYHLFAIDISSASFIIFGDNGEVLAWDPQRGTRHLPMPV